MDIGSEDNPKILKINFRKKERKDGKKKKETIVGPPCDWFY